MIDKIKSALKHCGLSIKTKWLVAVTILSVTVISAVFAPLVWAKGETIDSSSKIVTFYDEGIERTILTKGQTVADALEDAQIEVNDNDSVYPAKDSELENSMTVVNIRRARPVTVTDSDGHRVRIVTAEVDASKIAKQAGAELKSRDTVETSAIDDFVSAGSIGQQIEITRAKTVNLKLYGQDLTIRTQKDTVKDMLNESAIVLAEKDTVSVPLETKITDGMSLQIWRNGIQTVEQEEEIPFETQVIKDNTKNIGYVEVQTAGQVGEKTVIYRVHMQDGVEVGREVVSEVVTVPAVTQVEIQGTKVNLPPGSHTDWMRMAGIPESDFGAANFIISHESGWRVDAQNPNSSAYGLPQCMISSHPECGTQEWKTNPITQLRWFYNYCKNRYGSVQGAYNFKMANGWY